MAIVIDLSLNRELPCSAVCYNGRNKKYMCPYIPDPNKDTSSGECVGYEMKLTLNLPIIGEILNVIDLNPSYMNVCPTRIENELKALETLVKQPSASL